MYTTAAAGIKGRHSTEQLINGRNADWRHAHFARGFPAEYEWFLRTAYDRRTVQTLPSCETMATGGVSDVDLERQNTEDLADLPLQIPVSYCTCIMIYV